jgi:hypothetical protein
VKSSTPAEAAMDGQAVRAGAQALGRDEVKNVEE